MSNYVIVGLDDGIILDASRCVFFNTENIGEADMTLLDCGTETEAISVANRWGKNLFQVLTLCGFGDLNYYNCLSLTPRALREEFGVLSELTFSDNPQLGNITKWASELSDEELSDIAEFILQSDDLWDVWRIHVVEAMMWAHERKMGATDAG